jgi:hypothetical protein
LQLGSHSGLSIYEYVDVNATVVDSTVLDGSTQDDGLYARMDILLKLSPWKGGKVVLNTF